jgi:hypothetical protein
MLITQIIQDQYNSAKVWLVTKSKSGHYGLIQKINGSVVGTSPRYGKARIQETLSWATIN